MPTTEEVIELAEWCAGHIGQKPVAIVLRPTPDGRYAVAFSDGPMGPSIGSVEPGDVVAEILMQQFKRQRDAPMFVTSAIPGTVDSLHGLTGLPRQELAQQFAGDIETLEYTLGVNCDLRGSPEAEAAAIFLSWAAVRDQKRFPRYYEAVGVPWQRLSCGPDFKGSIHDVTWRVRYPELLTRVIANFSHEAVLMRTIDSDDVLSHLQERLAEVYEDVVDHDFAYKALLYAATGNDADFFRARFGELPIEDALAFGQQLDFLIPAVRVTATLEWQKAMDTGEAKTLYGRRLPIQKGMSQGEVLWFVFGGSVQDILKVAAVTFSNNGGNVEVSVFDSATEKAEVRGKIEASKRREFSDLLVQLSTLSGPLIPVPLAPIIIME